MIRICIDKTQAEDSSSQVDSFDLAVSGGDFEGRISSSYFLLLIGLARRNVSSSVSGIGRPLVSGKKKSVKAAAKANAP